MSFVSYCAESEVPGGALRQIWSLRKDLGWRYNLGTPAQSVDGEGMGSGWD